MSQPIVSEARVFNKPQFYYQNTAKVELSAFFAIKIQLKQKNINRAIDSIPIWPKPFFSEKHDEDILQGIVAGDVRFYPLLDLRGRFGKA
jgi:hypothetical protein